VGSGSTGQLAYTPSKELLYAWNGSAWVPFTNSGGGGGGMVYPGAGVPVSTGAAWGTSITQSNIPLINAPQNSFTGAILVQGPATTAPTAGSGGTVLDWLTADQAARFFAFGVDNSTNGNLEFISLRLNSSNLRYVANYVQSANTWGYLCSAPNNLGTCVASITPTGFSGAGGSITALNAANFSTGTLAQARGGTGVSNTATLTLGTTNQNWATLGTGIVKNTTTTGALSVAIAADFPTLNQNTTGTAAGLTGCTPSTAGSVCYWNGTQWVTLAGNASGTQFLQETSSGVPSWATVSGSGTVNSGTANQFAYYASSGTAVSSNPRLSDDATTLSYSGSGGIASAGDGVHPGVLQLVGNTTVPTLVANNFHIIGPALASFTGYGWQMPSTTTAGIVHIASPTSNISQVTISAIVGADMANNTVTATQLAAQYSKGSCTEAWGGSGTSFALTSGDDAVSNNTCYNDSGVTRTITAVKCRSSVGSNTTTVNPTMGSAGTGTTILSGALTCGSSYAYSSSGTVSSASWTTGTGITPAMGGTLTGTSIAMIVEYTY
jgi:hypothetical protein